MDGRSSTNPSSLAAAFHPPPVVQCSWCILIYTTPFLFFFTIHPDKSKAPGYIQIEIIIIFLKKIVIYERTMGGLVT